MSREIFESAFPPVDGGDGFGGCIAAMICVVITIMIVLCVVGFLAYLQSNPGF